MVPAVVMHVLAGSLAVAALYAGRYCCEPQADSLSWTAVCIQIVSSVVIVAMILFGSGLKLYPPRLRARLEIESLCWSLCVALDNGTSPRRFAAEPLLRRRFGLAEATQQLLAQWEAQLLSYDADAWRKAAEDMKAYLVESGASRGERKPLGRPLLVPDHFVWNTSAKVAVIVVLLWTHVAPAPLVSVATALEALTVFLACLMVLTMIRMIGDKVHDVRSKAGFRTILVTDQPELSWVGAFATWRLYARIGHAVVLFVRPTLDCEIEEPSGRGLYTVVCTQAGLADALAAFGAHADLIVLDTDNEALAADLMALSRLPNDRYRALSKTGGSPRGYRWVDPRTLMIDPADQRAAKAGLDPYVRSTRNVRPWATDPWVFLTVASALLFEQIAHGMPLVLFFVVAAILRILPEQLGPYRVRAISRDVLRAPANPATSRAVIPRDLHRTLWIATAGAGAGAIAYFVLRTGLLPEKRFDPTVVTAFIAAWLALFSAHFTVAGMLILRKWMLDWNFRIIVLRRNSRVYGYGHKMFVMATCGKYGQVTSLYDYELDRTEEDYGEDRESTLGSWFPIFSEIRQTLKPNLFFHVWQRQVSIEMQVADFAVFDWVEDITDNMRWELAAALKHLPAKRILIVIKPDNEADVVGFLDTCLALSEGRPLLLNAARERDDEYFWANHQAFDAAFRDALHGALAALTPESRPRPEAPIAGAWAYPCAADPEQLVPNGMIALNVRPENQLGEEGKHER